MDFLKPLRTHSDVAIGTIAGVVLAPPILNKVSAMFDLGPYEGLLVSCGVAAGSLLAFGKSKPEMAVAFASVFLAVALASLIPQLQTA